MSDQILKDWQDRQDAKEVLERLVLRQWERQHMVPGMIFFESMTKKTLMPVNDLWIVRRKKKFWLKCYPD